MEYQKGDILYADLGNRKNTHIQTGVRPVVVLQNNIGNIFSDTVIVAPLTSKQKKMTQPTHVEIKKDITNGLDTDSIVLLEQIRTIDEDKILKKMGIVSETDLHNINVGLIKSFGLVEEVK